MRKFLQFGFVAACAAVSLAPSTSWGADPVVAGSTQIGSHPSYGSGYSGFWRTGADYSLLTDATNTYVNAPQSSGGIWFRGLNVNWGAWTSKGPWLATQRIDNDRITLTSGSFGLGMGAHPRIAAGYAGLWYGGVCGNCAVYDYAFMTNGTNTYLNAGSGSTDGIMYFNLQNQAKMLLRWFGLAMQPGMTASKDGGGMWNSPSDARIKKDIVDFGPGLDALEKVRPVKFKYNGLGGSSDNGVEYVGVVAQELEKTLPFMVTSHKERLRKNDKDLTDIKQVDPSAFTYMLINSVKQLSADNKQLKRIVCADHPSEAICGGAAGKTAQKKVTGTSTLTATRAP